MSDNTPIESIEQYVPPPAEALDGLKTVIEGTSFAGYSHVAEPAMGWDVDGVWVSFATEYRSGYSVHSAAAAYALSEGFGLPTQLVPHRHIDIDPDMFPVDRRVAYDKWHEGKVGRAHLLVAGYPPLEAAYLNGIAAKLICYTAHEATRVSRFTVDICNKNFDEVWVVSDFCRRVFVESGVREEIVHTVPPMLYGGPWKQKFTEGKTGPFRFGTQGTWFARKGMLDLVRAYYGAFSAQDDVVLEIRTSQIGGRLLTINEMLTKIGDEIRAEKAKFSKPLPKISLYVGTDATDQEVLDNLSALDCYVNPSYGEGLGIPPIWAAMAGVPVIASTFGASGEYFAKRGSACDRLVPHHLEKIDQSMPSMNRIYDFDQEWGRYDVAEFGAAMRSVFDTGRVLDRDAAVRTRNDFNLDQMIGAMRPVMEKYLPAKLFNKVEP
jgi:glycosyltransferase involved in cell wall biosynthesis